MAKTFKIFLEGMLIEHPLQMLNVSNPYIDKDTGLPQNKLVKKFVKHHNLTKLGKGVDAAVVEKNSKKQGFEDPQHVYKVFKTHSHEDGLNGTLEYLTYASKHDNPYFPRVHSIKTYHHEDGSKTHVVKMEKLLPLKILKNKEHEHEHQILRNRMFHDPKDISLTKAKFMQPGHLEHITSQMHSGEYEHAVKNLKDPHLQDALDDIVGIAHNTGERPDVHLGNIMLRRTQHGLHPVITDPLHNFDRMKNAI